MERYGSRLSRRQFALGAAGLGLLAGCGRLPWQRQESAPAHRIGYLSVTAPTLAIRDALAKGLADYGYIEGQQITIEFRHAAAQADQMAQAVELVHLPVDLLLVTGARAIRAAMRATNTIPIVIAWSSGDPVEDGFVTSLARPGGNVTGLSAMVRQLSGKRLELVTEAIPSGAPIAVLWNAGNAVSNERVADLQTAAQALDVRLHVLPVREAGDLDGAYEAASRAHAAALIALHDGFTYTHQARVVALAAQHELPAMYENSEWTDAGGLMAYGASRVGMHRRAGYYVDRILKGAKPADLPIEQPMTFDFVVNMKTARDLGITFPNEIMLQVTEVIE